MKNKFNYMRFYLVLLCTLLLLFLTGCWSSKEVEELSLTAGIALDKGKDSTIEKEDEEGGYPKRNLITATYQIVREFSLKRESAMFSPHLKNIVISDSLVRTYSLEQLLEQYLRDNEVRLSCMILISKGLAKEVLESNKKEKSQHFVCLELQIIEREQQGFYLLYHSLNWKERCGQGPVFYCKM